MEMEDKEIEQIRNNIFQNYDILLELLKFSIEYDNNPQFKDFFLVRSYNQLLKEFKKGIRKNFVNLDHRSDYKSLLKLIFKERMQKYITYIDTQEKRELIKDFQIIMKVYDYAIDEEEDCYELGIIAKNMGKIIANLRPVLKYVKFSD